MPDEEKKIDKSKYGRTKKSAEAKGVARDAAFRKQCQAYKKANPTAKSCRGMKFSDPTKMTDVDKALYARSQGNLTKKGKTQVNQKISDAYNK